MPLTILAKTNSLYLFIFGSLLHLQPLETHPLTVITTLLSFSLLSPPPSVVSPVSALLHFLDILPFATS